jgi:hypothetical protein
MPIEGKTSGALNQTTNFCSREVFRVDGKFLQINVMVHNSIDAHFHGMDVEDLVPTRLIG